MSSLPTPLRPALFVLVCLVLGGSTSANKSALRRRRLQDSIAFAPLDSEICRPVADSSATILSITSKLPGQLILTVDWGDDKDNKFSNNAARDDTYHFHHAYDRPGIYDIKAKAIVRNPSEDGTAWDIVENDMAATVQVRDDCIAESTANRGGSDDGGESDIMSNWYGDMMADAIQIAPLDSEICLNTGAKSLTTVSVASIWSGFMSLNITWGDKTDNEYEFNVKSGEPYSLDHAWDSVGTYTVTAEATVKRLSSNRQDLETINKALTATVTVRDDCKANNDKGDVVGEWAFFEFAPIDTNICRSAGEEGTALSLMSIWSGFLTLDVTWGDGEVHRYGLQVKAGEPYSIDHIYKEAGTYEIQATAKVRRLNNNAHEWYMIAEQYQSWDVAEQHLVTTVGIREGCEDALSRAGIADVMSTMDKWFDEAISDSLQLVPLRSKICRSAGAEEAVLSVASLSSGFLNLVIDWGDENKHKKGLNVGSGSLHSFAHTYKKAGTYNVVAMAYVRRLSQDRKSWDMIENEVAVAVDVREDCTSINRAGIDIMGDWYSNMMDRAIQFKPFNSNACHSAGGEASLTVASVSSGYMLLDVDWGTGQQPMQFGMNVDTGKPYDIPHFYNEAGTYEIKAKAKVRILSTVGESWEVLEESFEAIVDVREDCVSSSPGSIDVNQVDSKQGDTRQVNPHGTESGKPTSSPSGAPQTAEPTASTRAFNEPTNVSEAAIEVDEWRMDSDGSFTSDNNNNGHQDSVATAEGEEGSAVTNPTAISSVVEPYNDMMSDALTAHSPTLNNVSNVRCYEQGRNVTSGWVQYNKAKIPKDKECSSQIFRKKAFKLCKRSLYGDGANQKVWDVCCEECSAYRKVETDKQRAGADTNQPDSDREGFSDKELLAGADPNDASDIFMIVESDNEDLSNETEVAMDTDPYQPDLDGDFASNGEQILAGADPDVASEKFGVVDSNYDGLSDAEIVLGTDPNHPDSNRDFASDGEELFGNTDPKDAAGAPSSTDSDKDSIADAPDVLDLTSNSMEKALGTDAFSPDSDGDGWSDQELVADTGPDDAGNKPAVVDSDNDGVSDATEQATGSDPYNADTDEDGLTDFEELLAGTDPNKSDSSFNSLSQTNDSVDGSDEASTPNKGRGDGADKGDVTIASITDGIDEKDDPRAKESGALGTAVGVSLAAAFFLFLLLFVRKQRRRQAKEEEDGALKDSPMAGMEFDEMSVEDGWDGGTFEQVKVSQYDEAGSFHLGDYHYSRGGVRYFSPSCKLCDESRA